jgi:branched-chain amino acid transport system ATP-binding protein
VVLLIDELSLGLAPIVVETADGARRATADGARLAILLVEQNAGAALEIADHGYVMEHGRIAFDGPRDRLLAPRGRPGVLPGVARGATRAARSYADVKQYRRRRRWF